MIWWLRTHRVPLQLGLCLAAGAAAPWLGSAGILLPSLGSNGLFVSAPLAVIAVLVIGVTAAGVTARADTSEWRTSARDLRVLVAVQAFGPFALVAAAAALWSICAATAASKLTLSAIGICGLQRLGRATLGNRYEAAMPVVYVFLAALFGRVLGNGTVAAWAWPIVPDPGRSAWAVVLLTLVVGLAADCCSALVKRPLLMRRPQLQARTG